MGSPPPGFSLFNLNTHKRTIKFWQTFVFVLTFLAYASFHASRKPPSIVKSVLGPKISDGFDSNHGNFTEMQGGWVPFDGEDGTKRLGELDVAFLAMYSLGMYVSGHIGDRMDLRVFLAIGMVGSGFFTVLFGMGFWWGVHSFGYFLVVQMVCGILQSSGWPSVVAVLGNWFDKSKRGLIMGVWSSNMSVGNILGSLIAAWALEFGWGWSFLLPGVGICLMGVVVYLFLATSPEELGFFNVSQDMGFEENSAKAEVELKDGGFGVESLERLEVRVEKDDGAALSTVEGTDSKAIGFLDAWRLPGVATYAFCLFFSKLVAYTFLYWLPFYIRHTDFGGSHLSHKIAGFLSITFDVGGVCGGILAGYISDKLEARAVTSVLFFSLSVPALVLYRIFGSVSVFVNGCMMLVLGLLVNGPYALITTAVAADIGTATGNSRALATVTAIIDGTGSIGAAFGPLLTGYISSRGWNGVFLMLIMASSLAALLLVRRAISELSSRQYTSATSG